MPTTHTTAIDLRGFHGREFEGVINDIRNNDVKCKGKISIDKNGDVYLCQNETEGFNAENKLGFKYSWLAQCFDENEWNTISLMSITILDPPSSIDPRWDWKMQEVVECEGKQYRCIRWNDEIVSFISVKKNFCSNMYTLEEAFKVGYRKLPTRKLTEITEEMFDKTNLIGRKVVYDEKEGQVLGMFIHPDESRSITIRGMVGSFTISQCKLIEE